MNWCIQDISLLYKSKNLHIKKYLDDLSLKRSWVVITKVASWSRNEPCLHSEYTIKSSLFNNVTFRMVINVMNFLYQNKPDEHSQILAINIYPFACFQRSWCSILPNPKKHMNTRTTTRCRRWLGSQMAGIGLPGPVGDCKVLEASSSSSPNKLCLSSQSAMFDSLGFAGRKS